ncbi:hypothetical protein HNQ07_000629 [Deinococcus metalli]|uniref:Uncharacterized protein n=1 Tax=Deinococcus metalli TaxID=1141878 RepID=A0A7W8NNY3_9DEIO|nr:hypothetical protein [Deinococcus metalli]MBB5375185.1 hypothetical protein [Deinococcus metalli]GHF31115.1 hypothetical protein GCM10017781_04120 [Deinococcus metalli]
MTAVSPDHVTATRHHARTAGLGRVGWRSLICGLLLALPLTGCGDRNVTLVVPSDPRVFNGDWSGVVKVPSTGIDETYPIAFHVVATPGNKTTYTMNGTMDLNGMTYTIADGHVNAWSATTFTAQQTLPPQPLVGFIVPLVMNGETVASVKGMNSPLVKGTPTWRMTLSVNLGPERGIVNLEGSVTRSAPRP